MTDDGDQYELYPCLVDGAPASIYVNLRYERDRVEGADTRYSIEMRFADGGPHGIGTAGEGEAFNAAEEQLIARLGGFVYVGRVRNRGTWETTFYGPAGRLGDVRAAAPPRAEIHTEDDREWRYYRELLLPDAERRQWIADRRLVQILREQGDPLTTPRRVDHRATFETAAARDTYVASATRSGFAVESESEREPGSGAKSDAQITPADRGKRIVAHVHRVDPIDLDHIHDVVMILVDAATAAGGVYDRWETSIETGS